jgi:hypothetical protein
VYFGGLPFLHNLTSALIGGVGRDVEHVVQQITSRPEERRRTQSSH